MKLSRLQHDRSSAVLLGMACGDALGAGYDYAGPLPPDTPVGMRGGIDAGVLSARGEWTDYTALAVPVANAAAEGLDLTQEATLDLIAAEWVDWANTAPFAGLQLGAALSGLDTTAAGVRRNAQHQHDHVGRSAGCGCLLRTAPVALAYLHDPAALAETARVLSDLTHCDTDAVAGAAGALLAARWGLAAVPGEWRRLVQGWPGLRGPDLVRLSVLAAHSHDTNEAGERENFRLHVVT